MADQPRHGPGEETRSAQEPGSAGIKAFLDGLHWPQGAPKTPARQSAVAVLCALERRLSSGEVGKLTAALPPGFRELLAPCAQHARSPSKRLDEAGLFLAEVGDHLGIDRQEAEQVARTVLAAVRDRLRDEEVEAVAIELPGDLADLWRRPV